MTPVFYTTAEIKELLTPKDKKYIVELVKNGQLKDDTIIDFLDARYIQKQMGINP